MVDKIHVRLREEDTLLREHFSKIKKGDHSHEARRLMEKALLIEKKEQEALKQLQVKAP
ncbi:hypothetical protein [Alicyclobacillus shizuokensis]|uniref:hypothetical protein n=1 Tax=Alicyclobacillus shizuokensis TaxID=392014 RepID=UPI000A54B804|nr:hypothetical protein [Alicyclobacillus shizuokensis]